MILSRLKFDRTHDRSTYQGFHELTKPEMQLRPGDRVVIVFGPPDGVCQTIYFVDCDGGLGELRRFFRTEHGITVELLVLQQDIPSWIVTGLWMEESELESEIATGPYWTEHDALDRVKLNEKSPGYMGGSHLFLNKP